MTTLDSRPLGRVVAAIANRHDTKELFTRFDVSNEAMSARLPILGSAVSIRVVSDALGGFLVGVVGLNTAATRWVHDSMVIYSTVMFAPDGKEIQVIHRNISLEGLEAAVIDAARFVQSLRKQEEAASFGMGDTVSMYWSSGTLNFGDWIGPHLVHAYTGRQPVQSNRVGLPSRTLYSVGSILGWIKRNNVDVWGSGLIKPFSPDEIDTRSKLNGVKIHAVRGQLTKKELINTLGWDVPDVFGDPGLLLPDFVTPDESLHGDVVCVPHYVHRSAILSGNPKIRVSDVRRQVSHVAKEIAGASAVISSSLHGLIVAQAYGIPWVWLDVEDHQLTGGDFKFNDFFSCLDSSKVSRITVKKDTLGALDFEKISNQATLPKLNIDLQLLRDSLPVRPATQPVEFRVRSLSDA